MSFSGVAWGRYLKPSTTCGMAFSTVNRGLGVRFTWSLRSSEEGKIGHIWLGESGKASRKKDESRTEENGGKA